jgi:hopanoid-associated phosphorylase
MLLVVTGLTREARIAASDFAQTICGGGNEARLNERLNAALRKPFRGIVSFGVAGALAPALKPGDCVLASQVFDGDDIHVCNGAWLKAAAARMPDAQIGAIAGSQKILARIPDKAALYRKTGALAVDMESQIASRAARKHNLPFLGVRTISDASDRALPPAALVAIKPDGRLDGFAIARSILARPTQIPDLIRTGRESEKAFAALLRSRSLLGRLFAFPDLG